MKRWIFLLLLLIGAIAYAAPSTTITIPNNFIPSTVIQSAQVNANFNEVQSEFNAHTHADITQLGVITTGTWNGTVLSTTFGGTGNNWGAKTIGELPYFSAAGVLSTLAIGTNGQVLTSTGAGAPAWTGGGSARDAITHGFEASASVTSLDLKVFGGTCFVGNSGVTIATTSILTFANAGYWSSGSVVSYAGGAGWCAIGVGSNNQYVKLLGPAKPHWSDIAGNSSGTNIYYWEQATNEIWRVIGAVRISTANQVQYSYSQQDNLIMYDIPVSITNAVSSGAWSNATACSGAVPGMSKLALFGAYAASAVGGNNNLYIRPHGSTWHTSAENGLYSHYNGGQINDVAGSITSFLDDSQQINYYNATDVTATQIDVEGYYLSIR